MELIQWQRAQEAERCFHNEDYDTGYRHYAESYEQYFKYLGIDRNCEGEQIIEIGPADFPALAYCYNTEQCKIIEPMPSEYLKRFGIEIIEEMAEDVKYEATEVWLFNVLQHTLNPEKIVRRAKQQSQCIRYFEPIDYGVDECHLWNLTEKMFKEWFGNVVNIWRAGQEVKNFHTWKCCYGVWSQNNL